MFAKGFLCFQDRLTFRRIVLKNAFNKRKMYEALLESVPMLKSLDVSFLLVSYDYDYFVLLAQINLIK